MHDLNKFTYIYTLNQIVMSLGAVIKQLRKEKNISQKQLAINAAVSNTHLCQIEKGNYIPSLQLLSRIAESLSIPATILVFMATDETDIKPDKLDLYKQLRPVIDGLIKQIL